MRVYGDEVLEKNDDARSQRRPEERSAAAQGDHEKHLHRSCQLQIHRADEAVVVRPQHAGEAAETTCNDKPDVLVEPRSEEHTSELQSRGHLVCRLLLEKKKKITHE